MALSTEDADEMIEVSKKMNVKLTVAHQNRFNPAVQKLRKAIEENRFGKLIAGNARVLWHRGEDYYKQAPWRGTYEHDGGCLLNQCIHNIDLLQWLLGSDAEEVSAMLGNFAHPYIEAEDYGSIQIAFKNGAIGNIEGTVCIYPKNLEGTIMIIGEDGTVEIGGKAVNEIFVWDFKDKKDDLYTVKIEHTQEVDHIYGFGHTLLYRDMVFAIRDNRKPYIDGEEGKKAMQIILCAYKSSREKKRVSVKENLRSIDFKK